MEKLMESTAGQDRFKTAEEAIEKNRAIEVKNLNKKRNELIDHVAELEKSLLKISFNLFRFVGIYRRNIWSKFLPGLIFALVAVTEMPLNITAFESLEMGQTETVLIAVMFGIVIAVMAEFTGSFLKRFTVTDKPSNLIVALGALAITVIGLYVSSELRVGYLEAMNESSTVPQIIWFFMSIFIFSVGVISAYSFTSAVKNAMEEKMYFEKLKEFDRTRRQISKIDRAISSVNKKSENELKKLMKEKSDEEKAQAKAERQAEAELKADEIRSERKRKRDEKKALADKAEAERKSQKAITKSEDEPVIEQTSPELEEELGKVSEKYAKQKVEISETDQTSETEVKK